MELRAMLVPIGRHPHPAGKQVIDGAALHRIASAAKRRGQDIPVDFDHATASSTPSFGKGGRGGFISKNPPRSPFSKGGSFQRPDMEWSSSGDAGAELAGHIAPSTLAVTPNGLRGLIVLNGRGAEALRTGAYRYLSPALLYNPRLSDGGNLHVERLVAVALTNQPNIPTMETLSTNPNLQEEFLMQELLDKLKTALGLPPGSDDAAALQAALERLEELSEPDDSPVEEAAEQEPGEIPEGGAAVDELAALKAELAQLRAKQMTDQINAAIADGKILPAQRDWAAACAGQDPEGFRRFLANSRPAVQMGAIITRTMEAAAAPLSAEQESVNRMLGINRPLFDKYNNS